jgi:transposase
MIQRGGEVGLHRRANVQQRTIQPILKQPIQVGRLLFTDEYAIYARLEAWGYRHQTVTPAAGEYARDEDGDGFHEGPVNTREGFGSLLRSWLRPHRGLSQEQLPV